MHIDLLMLLLPGATPGKMSYTRKLQELPSGRYEFKSNSKHGVWDFEVRDSLVLEKIDAIKVKENEELTENIGLPLSLLENRNPWPAYVTYTSPMVEKLIEKSKALELECMRAFEESQRASRLSKSPSYTQIKRKKSSKSTGTTYKDSRSETTLSVWGTYSVSTLGLPAILEPKNSHMNFRDSPTANYNKIIFSRRPVTRRLPYSSLLTNKEKHVSV
ncbi:CMT1A duplicated region transcript 4 protein isoform X2 [Erinaceus europaeus]|uniref:CMT1A duplicated region transcript 4 protein isoform X2 n=1 Tax=Erinaceus europaeus TaxID=9365 RepID=A0ABM3YHA3_ERIEU|nr:CMT1A duplicated region transcript 4 protein isoform X2 [Erinaceus europaeus]